MDSYKTQLMFELEKVFANNQRKQLISTNTILKNSICFTYVIFSFVPFIIIMKALINFRVESIMD